LSPNLLIDFQGEPGSGTVSLSEAARNALNIGYLPDQLLTDDETWEDFIALAESEPAVYLTIVDGTFESFTPAERVRFIGETWGEYPEAGGLWQEVARQLESAAAEPDPEIDETTWRMLKDIVHIQHGRKRVPEHSGLSGETITPMEDRASGTAP
jgi:hypothetical protein